MTRETGDTRVLVVIGAVSGLLIVPLTASDLPLWQVLGVSIAIGAALGQDDHDADQVRGGPNNSLSLTEARRSYSRIGAVEERVLPYVRPPTDGERPR